MVKKIKYLSVVILLSLFFSSYSIAEENPDLNPSSSGGAVLVESPMNDAEKFANHAKDFDVFVNSLYGPDGQQNRILEEVYKKFERGHIINISSTSSYWESGYSPQNYIDNKTLLDGLSKKMSNDSCWGNSEIKVSNIAFGQLSSQSQKERKDNRKKISLEQAGQFVKWVIDSPTDINIHYMAMDPIQRDQ